MKVTHGSFYGEKDGNPLVLWVPSCQTNPQTHFVMKMDVEILVVDLTEWSGFCNQSRMNHAGVWQVQRFFLASQSLRGTPSFLRLYQHGV